MSHTTIDSGIGSDADTGIDAEQGRIHLVLRGGVSAADGEYAQAKVAAVTAKFHVPVLFARLKLTRSSHPSGHRPAVAQANVEVNGRPVRAQVAAETMREAVDLLVDRLQTRLHQAVELRAAQRGGGLRGRTPDGGSGHRTDPLPEDREVVRHKSYTAASTTPEDAVVEMDLMDYHFHLFTDASSGEDCVVHRSGASGTDRTDATNGTDATEATEATEATGGYELERLNGTVDTPPAARLSLDEAKQRLDTGGASFVFFADAATGRGNVLYRRFDGHYGLITPAV